MTTKKTKAVSKIASWRNGSVGFFQWLDDVKPMIPSSKGGYEVYIPGPREREEIKRSLDGDYRTIVYCWPRRHGKTAASALIIVCRFLTRKTQTIGIVANSEKQIVDTSFRLVATILRNTPYTADLIKSGAITIMDGGTITYQALDNVIKGYSNNPSALYGKKLTIAQVSELHAASNDSAYQVVASSTIDTDDGLVLIDSTVGPRSSPLFALYALSEQGNDPSLYFSHIQYRDLEDACTNAPHWIKPTALRSRAAQMLPQEFAQQHLRISSEITSTYASHAPRGNLLRDALASRTAERFRLHSHAEQGNDEPGVREIIFNQVLNQWTSGTSSLFPPDIIERCKDKYRLDVKSIAGESGYIVGAGLDRAYGFSVHGDNTVTTCVLKMSINDDDHYYVLDSNKVTFSSAAGIRKALTRYHKEFDMSRACIESYNSQDIAAWCGDQQFTHELIHPTADKQAAAFTAVYNAAAEGRLHIHPSFEKLLEEMEYLEYKIVNNSTGKGGQAAPRFEAAKGYHDDHVYSLVWAIYALRNEELNPYEIQQVLTPV